MKHVVNATVTNKFRYVPANYILDELNKKRSENTIYDTAKTAYNILRTDYNTKLNALLGRKYDLFYAMFPEARITLITVPSTPNRPSLP